MDLFGQLQSNNRQINTLLNLVDNLHHENRELTRRIDEREYRNARGATATRGPTVTREPRGETGQNEPRNAEEDVLFYFYLPRRDEILSEETISQATTRSLFNEIENPNNLSCPISLELFQPEHSVIMINQCRHIFKAEHLSTWFETKSTCPMCRGNVQVIETPPLNRLANMATQMLSNALTTGVNDILNDFRI